MLCLIPKCLILAPCLSDFQWCQCLDTFNPIHTHSVAHTFIHPHNQPHPSPLFTQSLTFRPYNLKSVAPLTVTWSSMTVPFIHSPTYSHRILLTLFHIYDQSSHWLPFSPIHIHPSQLTHNHSHTRIQSFSFINSQSLTLQHRATFMLSAIHILHNHSQ